MPNTRAHFVDQTDERQAIVSNFVSLAVRGLLPMFDQQRQIFCYKLRRTKGGVIRQGFSHRYTMMTVLGLHRLEQAGAVPSFNTKAIIQRLLSDLTWIDNIGDLGVLLWLCGVVCPERLAELYPRLQLQTALARYRDARQSMTTELAWFLTGLSYWALAHLKELPDIEPLAFATYNILTKNQGGHGFFAHSCTSGNFLGRLRGRFGSFADQVYPIYAMAQFSKVYRNEEAATRALKCALAICEAQGPLGQWWWHYDAIGGRVADGYPVFSVHQHGMGPMTLFALGETVQYNFDPFIYKGLQWINSKNELSFNMEDASHAVIWRSISRSRRSVSRYMKARFGLYSDIVEHSRAADLRVLFECRPYELGWLLYAFAHRIGHEAHATEKVASTFQVSHTQVAGTN